MINSVWARIFGWTYVCTNWSSAFVATRGLVKVRGTIDAHAFDGALMTPGDGRHNMAVTAAARAAIGRSPATP